MSVSHVLSSLRRVRTVPQRRRSFNNNCCCVQKNQPRAVVNIWSRFGKAVDSVLAYSFEIEWLLSCVLFLLEWDHRLEVQWYDLWSIVKCPTDRCRQSDGAGSCLQVEYVVSCCSVLLALSLCLLTRLDGSTDPFQITEDPRCKPRPALVLHPSFLFFGILFANHY